MPDRSRTLLITPYFDAALPSGGVLFSVNIARQWLARGRSLGVLCAERSRSLGDLQRYQDAGQLILWPVATDEQTRFTHHLFSEMELAAGEILRDYRPEVIHIHNFQGMLSAVRAGLASEAPVILTALDLGMLCLNFCFYDGTATPCAGPTSAKQCANCIRKTIREPARWLSRFLPRSLTQTLWPRFVRLDQIKQAEALLANMHAILRGLDAIVTLSPIVASLLRKYGGADLPIREIAHSLPAERIVRPPKTHSDTLRLAFFGGTEPIKGLHVLIAAAQTLPDGLPIEIRAFGSDTLKQKVERLSPRTRRYLRHQTPMFGQELAEEHAHIDAVLVPSLCNENSPYVVMEALANGTAVIASDQAGIRHLIQPDRTGWLVEPGSPAAWCGAMIKAIDQPDHLRQMQRQARFSRTTADFVTEVEEWEMELISDRMGMLAEASAG